MANWQDAGRGAGAYPAGGGTFFDLLLLHAGAGTSAVDPAFDDHRTLDRSPTTRVESVKHVSRHFVNHVSGLDKSRPGAPNFMLNLAR